MAQKIEATPALKFTRAFLIKVKDLIFTTEESRWLFDSLLKLYSSSFPEYKLLCCILALMILPTISSTSTEILDQLQDVLPMMHLFITLIYPGFFFRIPTTLIIGTAITAAETHIID